MMIAKEQLEQLSRLRFHQAKALFEAQQFSGAYYLAGYAIECALKACIAAQLEPQIIPDWRFIQKIYTHNPATLVSLAGLEPERVKKALGDTVFAQHWAQVAGWSEESRYRLVSQELAKSMIDAIDDKKHGVYEWIKTHW